MKVALYCRVSTDEQAVNGYSILSQLNELKEYAKNHNYIIVGEYLDEGYSGGMLERPGLNNLLNDIKENKIDLVIFVKLDRWFRSVAHYYKIQEILEQYNVNWLATQEDYETITSSGKFKVNIMLSVSQQFKDATSERINNVFEYKVKVSKEVISGTKIYGYDIIDKKYKINVKEANNVKIAFEKMLELGSLSKTYFWWRDNISYVSNGFITKLLKEKKYCGIYTYKGKEYYDYIPQIIDSDLFYKVQDRIKNNIKNSLTKNNTKRYYIYSGLIYCGCCGRKYKGNCCASYKYYGCTKMMNDKLCKNSRLAEKKLEQIVLNKIIEASQDYTYNLKIKNVKTKKNIDNTPKIQDKIKRLNEIYVEGNITKDIYNIKLEQLNIELQQEKIKMSSNKNIKNIEYLATGKFKDYYNELDDEHKLLFNKNIIKKIIIKDKDNIIVELLD